MRMVRSRWRNVSAAASSLRAWSVLSSETTISAMRISRGSTEISRLMLLDADYAPLIELGSPITSDLA